VPGAGLSAARHVAELEAHHLNATLPQQFGHRLEEWRRHASPSAVGAKEAHPRVRRARREIAGCHRSCPAEPPLRPPRALLKPSPALWRPRRGRLTSVKLIVLESHFVPPLCHI